MQVSLLEGGVVEEKLIEEGSMVKKGDVLVRLSNNTLGLQILQSEADLAEQENFLRNTTVTMEQEKLDLEKQRLEYTIDTERKKRKYEQYRRLDEDGLVAREEYLQAKEDYELAVKSLELVIARQKQDSIYRSIQIGNLEESLESMRRSIQLVRQRVENLNVKSPIDGQLGSLDVILGQSIPEGTKIGQVNDLSDYKIEARIDEHYIDRVQSGLSATFERQGSTFGTVVEKVYPEVTDGQFKADFYFIHSPRSILPVHGRHLDLRALRGRHQGLPPRHPHRPPESPVLRGAGRTQARRESHHLQLRELRQERCAHIE